MSETVVIHPISVGMKRRYDCVENPVYNYKQDVNIFDYPIRFDNLNQEEKTQLCEKFNEYIHDIAYIRDIMMEAFEYITEINAWTFLSTLSKSSFICNYTPPIKYKLINAKILEWSKKFSDIPSIAIWYCLKLIAREGVKAFKQKIEILNI